jgi:stage V sporulation protein D (sporulation-specific penicillin-binding protein)
MDKKAKNKKEHIQLKKRLTRRIFIITLLFCSTMIALTVKVGYIKVVKGADYEKEVLKTMTDTQRDIMPQRGSINDRNGKVISTSTITYDLILDPKTILEMSAESQNSTYKLLSEYSKKSIQDIQTLVNNNPSSRYLVFIKHLTSEKMLAIKEKNPKGIYFEESFVRSYPKGEFASQVIGFFNKNSEGQYGIEQYYNSYLEGKAGRVFSKLQEEGIVTTEIVSPEDGKTIILTLDEVIQQYVEQTMKKYIEEQKPTNAAAIIMNPKTGEIYSMFSYPTFNPGNYLSLEEQLGSDVWGKMSKEEQEEIRYRAWKNFNTQTPYEPGSTFKPLVVAEAIEEGILSTEDTFECGGSITIAGTTINCWKTSGHGTQTVEEALANSCNVSLIQIGERISNSMFSSYLKKYGFGEKTGIDLPGEAEGILHEDGSVVDKATNSMGQNFTSTPLQLITGFSSVINGGYLLEPYIVSQIVDENGTIVYEKKPTIRRQVISNATSDIIREYLQSVVTYGTGSTAAIDGYSIGGKTGTAQKHPRSEGKLILSFVGYAPVEDPKVVALILFDEIPEGTGAPNRAFKEMMEKILPYLEIESNTNIKSEETGNIEIKDYKTMDLYTAIATIESSNLKYETIGIGKTVKNQYPAPGTKLPKGSLIKLYMTTDNVDLIEEVPDLSGLSIQEAKELVNETFIIKGNGEGKIQSQVPAPKYKIEKGSEIIVQTIE